MSVEKNLWSAVLQRAIEDLDNPEFSTSAFWWFNNKKDKEERSFIWICDILECDSDKIRRAIFNKYYDRTNRS